MAPQMAQLVVEVSLFSFSPLIHLNREDNVATTRRPVASGEALAEGVIAKSEIPRGHKVAVQAIDAGAAIIKYGQVIGYASAPVAAGEHVHTHNVEMREVELHHAFKAQAVPHDSQRLASIAWFLILPDVVYGSLINFNAEEAEWWVSSTKIRVLYA